MTEQHVAEQQQTISAPSIVLIALTAAAWGWAVVMTIGEYSNYTDRYDQANSAPQVSQIADEFVVGVMLWFVIAVAVTAVCAVTAVTIRLTKSRL